LKEFEDFIQQKLKNARNIYKVLGSRHSKEFSNQQKFKEYLQNSWLKAFEEIRGSCPIKIEKFNKYLQRPWLKTFEGIF